MEAQYDALEIVRIRDGFQLFDAESYERTYRRPDGVPLAPGYYIVTWPTDISIRRFDENALFTGPFNSKHDASSAHSRLSGS